jgi:hypothetical protein
MKSEMDLGFSSIYVRHQEFQKSVSSFQKKESLSHSKKDLLEHMKDFLANFILRTLSEY